MWLLADGTTDTLLYQFAQGKARQSEAFLSKAKGMCWSKSTHYSTLITFETAFLGSGSEESGDDETDNELEKQPATQAKLPSKRKQADGTAAGQRKKQKKKGGPMETATSSLTEPPLPSVDVDVPSPTSRQRNLDATSMDNDAWDLFGNAEDSQTFTQNRAASEHADGTASSVTGHLSPVSSHPNSPGAFITPESPPRLASGRPLLHSSQPSNSSSSLQTRHSSAPTGSSSLRPTIRRLQALPPDSDEDDELIPSAYVPL